MTRAVLHLLINTDALYLTIGRISLRVMSETVMLGPGSTQSHALDGTRSCSRQCRAGHQRRGLAANVGSVLPKSP